MKSKIIQKDKKIKAIKTKTNKIWSVGKYVGTSPVELVAIEAYILDEETFCFRLFSKTSPEDKRQLYGEVFGDAVETIFYKKTKDELEIEIEMEQK